MHFRSIWPFGTTQVPRQDNASSCKESFLVLTRGLRHEPFLGTFHVAQVLEARKRFDDCAAIALEIRQWAKAGGS